MIITLTALRLLAVYGASAAAVLWMVHRFVMPLGLAPALVLAVTPALLTGKALITGGVYAPLDVAYQSYPLLSHREEMGITTRNGLLIDVVTSYIPSQKAVRDAVKNGRLPLWNRFHMAGEPLLAFQQPAVLFPGTWLGFLLPLAQAWTFDVTLRSFFALLAAYLFSATWGWEASPRTSARSRGRFPITSCSGWGIRWGRPRVSSRCSFSACAGWFRDRTSHRSA